MKKFKAFDSSVVGTAYRPREDLTMVRQHMVLGEQLLLEREPQNLHDQNAIKVMLRGVHIGYLPAVQASLFAKLIDSGYPLTAVIGMIRTEGQKILTLGADLYLEPWPATPSSEPEGGEW